MFNNLKYWLFLVFCTTNAFAGWWSWLYCPESGGRTFEENQYFFKEAAERARWGVRRAKKGDGYTCWMRRKRTKIVRVSPC